MIHKGQRLSSVTTQNVGNRLQNHQIYRNIFVFTLVLINYHEDNLTRLFMLFAFIILYRREAIPLSYMW